MQKKASTAKIYFSHSGKTQINSEIPTNFTVLSIHYNTMIHITLKISMKMKVFFMKTDKITHFLTIFIKKILTSSFIEKILLGDKILFFGTIVDILNL